MFEGKSSLEASGQKAAAVPKYVLFHRKIMVAAKELANLQNVIEALVDEVRGAVENKVDEKVIKNYDRPVCLYSFLIDGEADITTLIAHIAECEKAINDLSTLLLK